MSDLNLQTFNKLYPMVIHKYNDLFMDQNATVTDKINSIIDYLNSVGKLTNDVVKDWNTVYQWVMNDGLTTDVNNKIEAMNANGELNSILTTLFNTEIGDLTTLQTTAKNNVVAAINENQTNIASNAASLAEIMQNALYAENYPRLAAETDDTPRLNRAIQDCITKNVPTLILAPIQYLINGTITVTSSINIIGQYQSNAISSNTKNGTVLFAGSGTNNPVLSIVGTSLNRIIGFTLANFTVLGTTDWNNNTPANWIDRIGIDIKYTAREFQIENVLVCGFKRQGLRVMDAYDGSIRGLIINGCGTDNVYPGLDISATGDNSNALHFFGLHMEFCPYTLRLDKSKNNHFVGCKFEIGGGIVSLNSIIQITASAEENDFVACQFTIHSSDNASIWSLPSQAPYMISIANGWTSIIGCNFSSPTATGSKWLNHTGIGGKFNNNEFNQCFAGDYSVILGSSASFNDNQMKINPYNFAKFGIKAGSNNIISNLKVLDNSNTSPTSGIMFNLLGTFNRIKDYDLEGYYNTFWSGSVENTVKAATLRPTTYTTTGTQSPDVSGISGLELNPSAALTITNFLNPTIGQEITLFADNGNTTIQNGANIGLKGAINVTLAGGNILTLFYVGGKWWEKSRNF